MAVITEQEKRLNDIAAVLRREAGKRKSIAIVDIDGTLLFGDKCIEAATKEALGKPITESELRKLPKEVKKPIQDLAATKYAHLAVPNQKLIDLLNSQREDHVIVVLTGRPTSIINYITEALDKVGLKYDQIVANPDTYKMHDEEFKLGAIEKLSPGFNEIQLYEDKPDNLQYFMRKLANSVPKPKFYLISGPDSMTELAAQHDPVELRHE
jgi:hypothetical protein